MKKQTALEKQTTNNILKYLNGFPCCKAEKRHRNAFTVAGEPDIFGCFQGFHFEIEVKREGNAPTELQLQRMEEWRATHCPFVIVATCLDDAKALIVRMGNTDRMLSDVAARLLRAAG